MSVEGNIAVEVQMRRLLERIETESFKTLPPQSQLDELIREIKWVHDAAKSGWL